MGLCGIQQTIGPRGAGTEAVKLIVPGPKIRLPRRLKPLLDFAHHLAGGDVTRIRHVINPAWSFPYGKSKAGAGELPPMGQGVPVLVDLGVALDLAEIVPWPVLLVERNPDPPDIKVGKVPERLFRHRLRSAVKTAIVMLEREIGLIRLPKPPDLVGALLQKLGDQGLGKPILHRPGAVLTKNLGPGVNAS